MFFTTSGAPVTTSPLSGIGDLTLPFDLAGLLVRRDEASVQSMRNHKVLEESDAAVIDAAAGDRAGPIVIGLGVHLPQQGPLPAMRIQLVDRAPTVGDVHEAVLDDRRALEAAMRPDAAALEAAELHRPGDLHALDVARVDLIERRETLSVVIFVMGDPVLRLLVGFQEALARGVRALRDDRRLSFRTDRRGIRSKGCCA